MSSISRLPPDDAALRPPHERGTPRAFVLAALFHLLLIALIAFGVHWRSHAPDAIEAELWSPTVQVAAPRPTAPLEHHAPQPHPRPQTPPPQPAPQPQPQQPSHADIVLQRQRELAALKQKQREEQLALEQQRKLRAQQRAEQQRLAEQKAQQQAEQRRLQQQREQQEKERQQKLAEQKKKQEERKRLEQQQAQLAASSRDDYMKQLMAQAGTGAANSTGTAAQDSGPSSGRYGQRIAGLIRQNTIFPEINQIQGNPQVTITVRVDTNSGEVLSATITHSSGVPSWDQAALRAIRRVGRFPPNSHGVWISPMIIVHGPRDPS